MSNPLLTPSTHPFGAIDFANIKPEHYIPALQETIKKALNVIAEIKAQANPTFENTIVALEKSQYDMNVVTSTFFNLHSAESSDELQAVAKDLSPILTDFGNDVTLDAGLFAKVKAVYDKELNKLQGEDKQLLEKTFKSFARNGALLNEKDKEKLRELDKELSKLSLEFGDNVLSETNAYEMIITDDFELSGLPESAIEGAKELAIEKGHSNAWIFNLQFPSYLPFMTYADSRKRREELYMARASLALRDGEHDNRPLVKKISQLRHTRANLLGYGTHADFILEERMAKSPETVNNFLGELLAKAKPFALKEVEEIKAYAKLKGADFELMPWDYTYYFEKLKDEKFSVNVELLRPYFKLENVIDGVFNVAGKLYGLKFKKRSDIPLYHKDVMTYEVQDDKGNFKSLFYADFFPRAGKRSGAWMTEYKGQYKENGVDHRPHVAIVCNFSKPTGGKPSLLTLEEVLTLFHEFGHALHGMLSNCKYQGLAGTNVFWDFVELPSQIFENWVYEKECLDLFAKHFETGETLPAELVEKIKASSNFHEGRATLRQISFAMLDMAWHNANPSQVSDVEKFEKQVTEVARLMPNIPGTASSTSFSHIFQGGYSAGYYSYKWAEVLDADAFEAFKENGIFSREVAQKFHNSILSQGGSRHPMELYKEFRGREPDSSALLKRAGLL